MQLAWVPSFNLDSSEMQFKCKHDGPLFNEQMIGLMSI